MYIYNRVLAMMWKLCVAYLLLLAIARNHISGSKISSTEYHIIHSKPRADPFNRYGYRYLHGHDFGRGGGRGHGHGYLLNHHGASLALPSTGNLVSTAQAHNPFLFSTPNQVTCPITPAPCPKSAYRSLDGSCNHLENPQWGVANSRYGRLLSPKYADGVSAPPRSVTGGELPNARLISLVVFGELPVQDPQFTLINMQWGQILTHDMSMQAGGTQSKKHPTRCCTDDGRLVASDVAHKTCFAILIPPHDPVYSQAGIECQNFVRTLTDRDGNCPGSRGPAEQLTVVTPFMDLSLVYGNSGDQNAEIRAFYGGRMLVEERNGAEWLPSSRNITDDCDVINVNEVCYRAGDVRVNQNPGLALLQTVLLREHNRIADTLAKLNPHYDDETLFQEARKINIAQYQHISYYEWLPIFLGAENMLKNRLIYKVPVHSYVNDYSPAIDPSVLNSHATAAFRYFHTQIEGRLDLLSEPRSVLGSLRLSDWFNRPAVLEIGDNFDALTRGHATQPEELTDNNFDREIKHFLFRRNMPFGLDLQAFDIQRSRDHGLASYNDYREFCGLRRAHSWEDYGDLIDSQSLAKLKTLYANYEDVDLVVGGSLEAHVVGALAGPTFLCILTEQFFRTRVGDRFFYENGNKLTGFTPEQLAEIRKASMARLLCDNGNHIQSMQPKAFVSVSKSNPILPCSNIPQVDLTKWIDQKPYIAAASHSLHYGK